MLFTLLAFTLVANATDNNGRNYEVSVSQIEKEIITEMDNMKLPNLDMVFNHPPSVMIYTSNGKKLYSGKIQKMKKKHRRVFLQSDFMIKVAETSIYVLP